MKTYQQMLDEAKTAEAALRARDLTTEELARLEDPADLTRDFPAGHSYAIGGVVDDARYGKLTGTFGRNITDVNYALKAAATNPRLSRLHAYPEAF